MEYLQKTSHRSPTRVSYGDGFQVRSLIQVLLKLITIVQNQDHIISTTLQWHLTVCLTQFHNTQFIDFYTCSFSDHQVYVLYSCRTTHDDIIKWKHFLCYWPFVWGIHWSPVNSPHKRQWCGALMFSFIGAWINGWVNNREAGDFRFHHAHYSITVMYPGALPLGLVTATH